VFVCLSVCLFVYSFIRLFVYSFIRLFVYLFIHLFVYSSIRLFVHCSFIHSFVHLFIRPSFILLLDPSKWDIGDVVTWTNTTFKDFPLLAQCLAAEEFNGNALLALTYSMLYQKILHIEFDDNHALENLIDQNGLFKFKGGPAKNIEKAIKDIQTGIFFTSYHITSHHITSHHITSHHTPCNTPRNHTPHSHTAITRPALMHLTVTRPAITPLTPHMHVSSHAYDSFYFISSSPSWSFW